MVLLKSIFAMGIPVSGKNLFPSNIAGLPTWYTIRASKHGYVARKREIELLVAMNPETAREDMLSLPSGAVAIYDEALDLKQYRDDVVCYPVPFDKLTAAVCPEAKLRKLVRNMIYVGIVAQLLAMDLTEVEEAVRRQFASKQKAADLNWTAVKAGYDYAAASLNQAGSLRARDHGRHRGQDHHRRKLGGRAGRDVRRRHGGDLVPDYALLFRGRKPDRLHEEVSRRAGWQSKLRDRAGGRRIGRDRHGAGRGLGRRALDDRHFGSGHLADGGVCGLGYFAELPGVIFDIQRVGPSTGMPTRTMQGDLLAVAYLSHGDTKHVMLLPASVNECYEFSMAAFEFAEQLQTPIFVLSDLDLGMNNWMSEPFAYPEKPLTGARCSPARIWNGWADLNAIKTSMAMAFPIGRCPGTDHPKAAYFTRGSGHNEKALYTERPDDYQSLMERLARKFETARSLVPAPEVVQTGKSPIGLIAFGSTDFALRESRDQLKKEYQLDTDYLRLRAFPFPPEVLAFIACHTPGVRG